MEKNILIYTMIGLVWTIFMEVYTTRNLEPPYNKPWNTPERLSHLILWPINLTIFLYYLFNPGNDE
jgi:hypothetical protein